MLPSIEGLMATAKAKGDLNGDGVQDIALIARKAPGKPPKGAGPEESEEEDLRQFVALCTGDISGAWKSRTRC